LALGLGLGFGVWIGGLGVGHLSLKGFLSHFYRENCRKRDTCFEARRDWVKYEKKEKKI